MLCRSTGDCSCPRWECAVRRRRRRLADRTGVRSTTESGELGGRGSTANVRPSTIPWYLRYLASKVLHRCGTLDQVGRKWMVAQQSWSLDIQSCLKTSPDWPDWLGLPCWEGNWAKALLGLDLSDRRGGLYRWWLLGDGCWVMFLVVVLVVVQQMVVLMGVTVDFKRVA